MTDNVESTANVSTQEGSPSQNAAGASQVSSNSLDVDALVTQVAERLFPEIDKRTQSAKDKRIAELLKGQQELRDLLAGTQTQPVQPQPVKDVATVQANVNVPVQQVQPGKVEFTDEANAVLLKAFELDPSDPAVVSANTLDPALRIIEYGKIVERRKATPPASAASPQSGVQQSTLEAGYKQEFDQLRQGDVDGLLALKRKYREKGLAI